MQVRAFERYIPLIDLAKSNEVHNFHVLILVANAKLAETRIHCFLLFLVRLF